jgi:hypothetical protein
MALIIFKSAQILSCVDPRVAHATPAFAHFTAAENDR